MTTKLRKLFEKAVHAVNTYKNPDIDEARQQINLILEASGGGSPGYDYISDMCFHKDDLHICTEYSVRSCSQSDEYTIPAAVIDADDPIYAAKVWGADKELLRATQQLHVAERQLQYAQDLFNKCQANRNALNHE